MNYHVDINNDLKNEIYKQYFFLNNAIIKNVYINRLSWQFNLHDKSMSIITIYNNFTFIYFFTTTNFNVIPCHLKLKKFNIKHNILWKLILFGSKPTQSCNSYE
jgi:hypothetical protein